MGSRWEEHPGEEEHPGVGRLGLTGAPAGLQAVELDLLRSAPDYDAEEMATVRPMGGWPTPPSTAAPDELPPSSSWMPPNRVAPPAKAALTTDVMFTTAGPAFAAPGGSASMGASDEKSRFPEERTMALMAEDLLGRPLDEPEPTAGAAVCPVGVPRSTGSVPVASGTDIWDAAMPMLVEG